MDLGDADMPKSCPKPCVFLGLLPPQGVVDNYDANRLWVVDIYGVPRLLRRLEYYKARRRYYKARPRHYKARPLSRAAAQTRSRAAAQIWCQASDAKSSGFPDDLVATRMICPWMIHHPGFSTSMTYEINKKNIRPIWKATGCLRRFSMEKMNLHRNCQIKRLWGKVAHPDGSQGP